MVLVGIMVVILVMAMVNREGTIMLSIEIVEQFLKDIHGEEGQTILLIFYDYLEENGVKVNRKRKIKNAGVGINIGIGNCFGYGNGIHYGYSYGVYSSASGEGLGYGSGLTYGKGHGFNICGYGDSFGRGDGDL